MISQTSRYNRNVVAPVTDEAGVTRLTILPLAPAARTFTVQYYSWGLHDRVDLVAKRFYDSEQLWWMIADANPQITLWLNLPQGTVIRIPQ